MSTYKTLKEDEDSTEPLYVLAKTFKNATPMFKGIGQAIKSAFGADLAGTINGTKAALSGLFSVVKAHPILAAVSAAGLAYKAFKKLSNVHNEVVKEASDNLFGANEDYNGTVSEIESINSELETTQARMNELQAKGYLSLTEKEELFNLQQQNNELERTLSLKEMEAKIDARSAAQKADEAYDVYTHGEDLFGNQRDNVDQTYNRESIDDFKGEFADHPRESRIEYIKYNATASWLRKRTFAGTQLEDLDFESHRDNINYLIAGYESIQSEKKAAEEDISDIAEQSKTASGKEMDDLTKQSNALQKYYEELSSNESSALLYMNKYASVMQEAYSSYTKAEAEGVILPDQKKRLEEAKSFLTEYGKIMTNTAMDTEDAINNIFAKSEFAGLQEKLLSRGESDGPDAVAKLIAETPELTDTLADAGIEAEQLTDHIMAIADPSKLRLDVVKDQIRDAFVSDEKDFDSAKVWDDFVKDHTDREIELFYRYKLDKNLDMSDWNPEDLQYNMQQALDWAAEENPLDFSSILSTEEMSKQIDDFQSNTSAIQSALASIKEGEDIDLTDLVQQFPELAGQTDNLQKALSNLQIDKIREFGKNWKSSLEGMDKADISKANEFFSNLIDGIDLSALSNSDLKKEIANALLPDPGDNYSQEFLNEFKTELSNRDDMELLWKIAMDPSNANKSIQELRSEFDNMKLEAKAYVKWDEKHPGLDARDKAEQTANEGDRYLKMLEDFKDANEAYKKSLIGTDDFETAAAMISPTGMTDVANWEENYGKVQRYFTEDSEGVLNFLNDLSTKTDAAGQKLAECNENTGEWSLNLADMGDAADQLGVSFEAFTAILGRLGDYGFVNDFFSTVEEGVEKSADLHTDLAKARAKYAELLAENPENKTALASQLAEIERLERRIANVDEQMENVKARSLEEYEEEAREKATLLNETIKQYDRTEDPLVKSLLGKDIVEQGSELGYEIDLNADGSIKKIGADLQQYLAEKSYDMPVLDTHDMQESISAVLDDEANGMKERIGLLSKFTKEELQDNIKFGDGMTAEGEFGEVEKFMDELLTLMGLEQDAGDLALRALSNMGELKEIELPEIDTTELQGKLTAAMEDETSGVKEQIDSLSEYTAAELGNITFGDGILDSEFGDAEKAIDNIISALGLGQEDALALVAALQEMGALKIDPKLEDPNAIPDEIREKLNQPFTAKVKGEVDVEETEIHDIEQKVTQIPETGKLDAVIAEITEPAVKPIGFEPLGDTRKLLDEKATITFEKESSDVDAYQPEDKEATATFEKDSSEPDSYQPDPKFGKAIYNVDSSAIAIWQPPEKSGTVTYHVQMSGSVPTDAGGTATGTMLSSAYADGTAYNVHNLIPLSLANAMGSDVAIKKDQKSLLNEVGQESLIRDGKWYLIPGGTQVGALKKNDIVINAAQTEALLKYGKLSTFAGNAYATGTMGQIPLMYARAEGTGSGTSFGPAIRPPSSSNDSQQATQAVQQAAKKVSNNSDKTSKKAASTMEKFEKWIGNLFDWVEVKLNNLERIVSRYYDKAQLYIERGLDNSKNYAGARSNLQGAIDTINKQIVATREGKVRYREQASITYDKAAKALKGKDERKFHDAVKTLKSGGTIDITEYNEKVRKALDEYQKWYDMAQDNKQTIIDLNGTLAEYREELYNLPLEQAAAKIDKLSAAMDVLNKKTDIATSGGSAISNFANVFESSVASADSSRRKAASTYSARQKEANTAKSAYDSAVSTEKKTEKSLSSATKTVKKYGSKLGKKRLKQIANGEKISTKGLKGKVLSAAKKYNAALAANEKAENVVASKKSAYSNAKSALTSAANAKKQIDSYYAELKKQQDEIKKYENKASYEYANYIAKQELNNTTSQHDANLTALRQAEGNVTSAAAKQKSAQAAMQKKANQILNSSKAKKLTAEQKKALKSGNVATTLGVKDKSLKKALNEYAALVQQSKSATDDLTSAEKALLTAQQNATTSATELAAARTEYAQKTFDNIKNYYDSAINYLKITNELEEKAIELSEAHGNYTSQSDYDKQIANRNEEMKKAAEMAAKLQEQLNANVKAGYIKEGSQEWEEMQSQIAETQSSVKDFEIEIENLKQQKLDAYYEEVFDRVIKKAEKFQSTLSGIQNFISEEMMYDRDTGHLTEMGMLSALLNVQNLNSNLEELKKYTEKLNQIEADYRAGAFGEKEYDEKIADVRDSLMNGLGDINSAREAIINVFETLANKEKEAILKVMNAHKDALQAKKDYAEYDKNIRNQTKEINLLKQQIAALEGVTTAEEKAKKAKLEAELAEKQEELDETTKDHEYELKITGIEEFEETLNENYEKYIYELKGSLDKMAEAIKDMTTATAGNVSNAIAQMNELLKKMGVNVDMSQLGITGMIPHNSFGTKNARAGMNELVEHGSEIHISRSTGRIYKVLQSGDQVIPHQLSENLWDLAHNRNAIMSMIKRSQTTPTLPVINMKSGNGRMGDVSIHYDALINVEGNLDSVTGAQVIDIIKKQMPKIYEYNVSHTIRDARKRGLK